MPQDCILSSLAKGTQLASGQTAEVKDLCMKVTHVGQKAEGCQKEFKTTPLWNNQVCLEHLL